MLDIVCYSCKAFNHIAKHCPKIHFTVSNKSEVISRHLYSEREIQSRYQRAERGRFHPRHSLQLLDSSAVRLRNNARQHSIEPKMETYNDLGDDSFEAVLDRKVYDNQVPVQQQVPQTFTDQVIDSLESMGPEYPVQKHVSHDTLPPGTHPVQSLQSLQTNYYASKPALIPSKFRFTDKQMELNRADSGSAEQAMFLTPKKASSNLSKLVFDYVCNFETYYPTGNISVVSRKHNEDVQMKSVALQLSKGTGSMVSKNVLKSIDILSRGSLYGKILRESVDSLPSGLESPGKAPTQQHSSEHAKVGDPKLSSKDGSGSFLQITSSFLQPHSSDLLAARRPSIFKSGNSRPENAQNQGFIDPWKPCS